MNPEIRYRKIEKYLNILNFKGVKIGSLLSQTFEIDYYNNFKGTSKNTVKIFKYLLFLFFVKNIKVEYSKYIFTKLINRFHFNELIDPLIIHFLDQSTILCNRNSFNDQMLTKYPINQHILDFDKTINNSRADILDIISVFFTAFWVLIKNKKRLNISKKQIIFFLSQLLPQLRRVSFWDYYFSRSLKKPNCIITEFDRNYMSNVLILSGKKYKINTITLTHGVICDYGFTPVLADYIFCWGKFQKDQLINQGVPEYKIFITGNPMIKNFRQTFLPSSRIIRICFAISPEFQNRSMIMSFITAIKNFNQIEGLIKLHPSHHKQDFDWISKLSTNVKVLGSEDIKNEILFEEIDLLVIRQSGIANEALSSGVPVIIFEPGGINNLSQLQNELITTAGCKAVIDSDGLITLFKDFLSDPYQYHINSSNASISYLKNLYETIGEDSIKSMISDINQLTA